MKASSLSALMYNDHQIGESFNKYSDEEIMSVLNLTNEMIQFFLGIRQSIIVGGLVNFELQLKTVLRARGKEI